MLFWLGLVAGLIIGWVVEWVIDWSFWRRDAYASLEDESRLRTELDAARAEISKLQSLVAIPGKEPSKEPSKEPGKEPAATITPDQLQNIHGIGNVFAKRLNEAGIFTFAQLGVLTVDEVAQIIKPQEWQSLNFDSWITQARSLSTKVNKGG